MKKEENCYELILDDSKAIELRLRQRGEDDPLEVMTIRKDAITSVSAYYQSRNLQCWVNGIETQESYDQIIKALGWEVEKP